MPILMTDKVKQKKKSGCTKKRRMTKYDSLSGDRNNIRKVIKMYKRLVYLGKRKYNGLDKAALVTRLHEEDKGKVMSPILHARTEAMKCASAHGAVVEAALQRHLKGGQ